MSFVISPEKFQNSVKEGDIYIKGDYYKNKKGLIIKQGGIFNYNDKELFSSILTKGNSLIPKLKGEFFLVWYDKKLKEICIGNDKLGREILFYFYNKKKFIISNDFWEIINIIEPNESDINIQHVKEFVIFGRPLFFKTIVNNLNFFPAASISKFSIKDKILNINNYWDFKYTPDDNLSLNEAAERIDMFLSNALRRIKEKHNPETVYGSGLSGGLDSRLIPHYAVKYRMRLKNFIIGERKPNKLFLSRDHASARKIAKLYKLKLHEIPYNCINFEEKAYSEIRFNPTGSARLFQTINKSSFPKFDVLLTGMNGNEVFGSDIPLNIQHLNKDQLVDSIISSFFYVHKQSNRFKRTFKFLFGFIFREDINKRKIFNPLVDEETFIRAKQKIKKFVEAEIKKNKTNVDIIQKYVFSFAQISKYNSFGMFWNKKNYSIFLDPYFFEETLRWKAEFLINRKLQNQFFLKKVPKLAKIPPQDFQPAIFYRNKWKLFRKVLAMAEFILRGWGVVRYNEWSKKKEYLDFARKVLSEDNKIFKNIFNVEDILNSKSIHENLVKIKLLLDFIENKKYKRFFEENSKIKKHN